MEGSLWAERPEFVSTKVDSAIKRSITIILWIRYCTIEVKMEDLNIMHTAYAITAM